MVRVAILAGLIVSLAGCAQTSGQQRLAEYNQDGLLLFEQGSFDHAREEFEAALALKPNEANLLYNLGRCHEKLGQADKAEARYNECLRASSDHAACRYALAKLLIARGRRDD